MGCTCSYFSRHQPHPRILSPHSYQRLFAVEGIKGGDEEMGGWRRRAEEAEGRLQAMEEEREKEKAEVERKLGAIVGAITEEARRWEEEARRWQEEARRWGEEAAGQLIHVAKEAGWQPIVYSKTAARLFKAAWCLLRIATPYPVLRRLTEVAVGPADHIGSTGGQGLRSMPSCWHLLMTLQEEGCEDADFALEARTIASTVRLMIIANVT